MRRVLGKPFVFGAIFATFGLAIAAIILRFTDWPAFWTRIGVSTALIVGLALYVFLYRHRQNRRRDAEAIQGTE
ncbi:hypothetical protein [Jonesia quinghaiensis]|uniref:hypothetical protein n=1 Tax=Jonesia quinghaiensis TaxID=262806 RepID=UPI0012F7EC2E|nr:hypothetical protein [Jonesia quinghaiensis]